MYFTSAAPHRHDTAICNPADYVCGNVYGVPGIRQNTSHGQVCGPPWERLAASPMP